jgi:hypothetical protein
VGLFPVVIRTILTWLVSDEPLKLQYREVEKVPSTELFNPLGEFRQLVITCYTGAVYLLHPLISLTHPKTDLLADYRTGWLFGVGKAKISVSDPLILGFPDPLNFVRESALGLIYSLEYHATD